MKNPDWIKCMINGDSKDIIKRIPDNSIDFILTDPPYNLGKHSTGNIPLPGRSAMNNDIAAWDLIDFNPSDWADEFIRILKPSGNLFIFTSYNQLGKWYDCLDHKFDTTNFMIWHKTNPAPKIFKAGFLNSCEMIFTCWNKKHTWNFSSQAEMHNFIESSICMRPERLTNPKHPSQKPVKILKRMIEIASNPGDIVFDPFMGVGSVGVAALELGRKFIGVEIDSNYWRASKERINMTDSKMQNIRNNCEEEQKIKDGCADEPIESYGGSFTDLDLFVFSQDDEKRVIPNLRQGEKQKNCESVNDTLAPIIKWPGGKEKELKHFVDHLPVFKRFFDPFVGGGSVFMAVEAERYFVNDLSEELMLLYKYISESDKEFFNYAEQIDNTWKKSFEFFISHPELINLYISYRNREINDTMLKQQILAFCKTNLDGINEIVSAFRQLPSVLFEEMTTNLYRKMRRMSELERKKHCLPENDLRDNIETTIKSAVYMNFRFLYNNNDVKTVKTLHTALFFFIRNYAYSGMFRYSGKGDFNVPYGGIAYNNKSLSKKLNYYCSRPLLTHLRKTQYYNLDFEKFIELTQPGEDDFVFLDPPYDTEFSTYARNAFTRKDQERLAEVMINRCKAKWMLIIKNTDFIFNLYNRPGIRISSFEKNYTVSFMNRNNRKATHLIITNY